MSCTGCEHGGVVITTLQDVEGPNWVDFVQNLANPDTAPLEALLFNTREVWEVAEEAGYNSGYYIGFAETAGHSTQEEPQGGYPSSLGYGSSRNGWKFTPDAEPDIDAGDPTEVYILPLSIAKTAVNGSCSTATLPDCTGGSPCSTTIVWAFEIWSVIRSQPADGIGKSKVTPVTPTTFSISDPNGATSGATFSIGNFDPQTYQDLQDPRGDLGSDADVFSLRRQEATLNLALNPDACGEAAWWESDMRNWTVAITGYTMQTEREVSPGVFEADPQHVEAGTFVIGAYCARCYGPMIVPDPGGGQGGGKNQNINSIGN